jgi:hypothetical protein
MDTATFEREMEINRRGYEALREQIQRDHAGQYVALAHGRLIAAAPTFDEAFALVQRLEPVPECFLLWPADEEPDFEPYEVF